MAEWKRLTQQKDGEFHLYYRTIDGKYELVKLNGQGICIGNPTRISDAELAALPTVKARDVRIERLEAVVLQAIEYIKDLIADGDEQWRGDNSVADAALERLFDGEKDDKILSSLIAALEAGDRPQPGEVG